MGRLEYFKGQYRVAERFYKKALARKDLRTMPYMETVVSLNYGVVCDLLEQVNESMKAYLRAQRGTEALNDSTLMTKVWINLALLDKRLNRFDEAIKLTNKALDVAKRRGEAHHIALCYQNLSIFYSFSGRKAMSYSYRDSALVLLRETGNPIELGRHLVNIADDKLAQGLSAEALPLAQEVLAISKEMELPDLASNANSLLARVYLARNEFGKAEYHFKEARRLAQSIESLELEENALAAMTDLYARTGRIDAYQKTFADFIDVGNKLNGLLSDAKLEELKVLYELDKAGIKNEALRKENDNLERQRILLFTIAAILFLGGEWIYRQHRKLSGFVKSLFMLNLEQGKLQEPMVHQMPKAEDGPSVFTEGIVIPEQVRVKETETEVDQHESVKRYQQIVSLISEERLFTDPEFSLQKLTTKMGSNQKYISQAINRHSNTNFNGLVNRLRVNEARRLMIDEPNKSLGEVMDESGFSNRVTFYRQFKEITGFSPSEFQTLLLNPPVAAD